MNDLIQLALQNLINGTATDEEVVFLRQEMVNGKISIIGLTQKSFE